MLCSYLQVLFFLGYVLRHTSAHRYFSRFTLLPSIRLSIHHWGVPNPADNISQLILSAGISASWPLGLLPVTPRSLQIGGVQEAMQSEQLPLFLIWVHHPICKGEPGRPLLSVTAHKAEGGNVDWPVNWQLYFHTSLSPAPSLHHSWRSTKDSR